MFSIISSIMRFQNIFAIVASASLVLAAPVAIQGRDAAPAPAAKPQYGNYGSYSDIPSYGTYEDIGEPTEYGTYGDYGAYKREAKPDPKEKREPEPQPEAAPEEKRDAKPQYGDYGDYGSYDNIGEPTEYGSYGSYGAYKREAEAKAQSVAEQ